jgi:Tfp pilus assembly protein PilX
MSRARHVCSRTVRHQRRGAIVVMLIIALVIGLLVVSGLVLSTGREQDLTVRRLETIQSFYAAEAGMNMAIREMSTGVDEDADGAVGTISDDGNAANDPTFGSAQVGVSLSTDAGITTLTSVGRSGDTERHIEALLQ